MTTSNVIHFPTGRPLHHDIVALEAVVHRYHPAWVTADPLYSISVPHLERHGWDIRAVCPHVFQCSHPRVMHGPVDYITALEITLMFLLAKKMGVQA